MINQSLISSLKFPLVVATHMRSGTHLTIDLIRRQFRGFGGWKFPLERNDTVYLAVDSLRACCRSGPWSDKKIEKVLKRSEHVVGKLHWTTPDFSEVIQTQPAVGEWLRDEAKIIYVVRNPKAVVQSLWNWELAVKGIRASNGPPLDWLRERFDVWAQHVKVWTSRNGVLILRFEDLIRTPSSCIARIESFLRVEAFRFDPLLPSRSKGRWHSRFNRIFARTPLSTQIMTTKKSTRFQWDKERTDLAQELCGKQSIRFGYE